MVDSLYVYVGLDLNKIKNVYVFHLGERMKPERKWRLFLVKNLWRYRYKRNGGTYI